MRRRSTSRLSAKIRPQAEPLEASPLPIASESFQLAPELCIRLAPNAIAPERPAGNPAARAAGSIFRLGLSERLPGLRRGADPSAPDAAANAGLRLCSTLRHRPAGTLRLASKIHLPARPVTSFRPLPDFCRRLAPTVSIRDPPSPRLRNCAQGSNTPARAGLVSSGRASVLNLRLAPSVALSG